MEILSSRWRMSGRLDPGQTISLAGSLVVSPGTVERNDTEEGPEEGGTAIEQYPLHVSSL